MSRLTEYALVASFSGVFSGMCIGGALDDTALVQHASWCLGAWMLVAVPLLWRRAGKC